MSLGSRSSIADVAAAVAQALAASGIRGVLTGGACASLHTRGAYQSSDLDFVIESASRETLDAAMSGIGFARNGGHYEHADVRYFIEFLPAPLAIGGDTGVRPVEHHVRSRTFLTLSPTDSCRDRLAAFYFWNDRQSLRTAVEIARRHPIEIEIIRRWSEDEGKTPAFEEFLKELARAKERRRRP